jgi:hypothetical protein
MAKPIQVPDFAPQPDDPCFCGRGPIFGECCGNREKRRQPPHGVQRVPGFIAPKLCRKWVAYLERQPRGRSQVYDEKRSSPGNPVYVEDPIRVCSEVHPGSLSKPINQAIARAYRVVTQGTGRSIEWFEQPKVLRYESGGHYVHHSDSVMWDKERGAYFKVEDRDLSLLIYLNDDFEGGGLSFTRLNCGIRPRVGDMLMFPSGLEYEHRANLVTSGFRYAIASWAAYKGEQRVRDEPPEGAIFVS